RLITRGADVLVRAVTVLIRVRGDSHAIADDVGMDVGNVLGGGDLRVRQDETATLLAILHVEHKHTRRELLLVVLDRDVGSGDGNVPLAVNLLQNLSLIRLKELQGRGLRELGLNRADNLPTPRTNVIGGTLAREGNALIANESQGSNPSRQRGRRVSRKGGINRTGSNATGSCQRNADHRTRQSHVVIS